MKLVNFTHGEQSGVGILENDTVYLTSWQNGMFALVYHGTIPERTGESIPLADVTVKAPYVPGKMLAIGRNYASHAAELNNEIPKSPLIFAKLTSSIIGTAESITWSTELTSQVDWEGELAVIIGKTTRNVSVADALHYVYGYTIGNDVSARDLQDSEQHWIRAKGLDTFCPLGPVIVTADEIPDPHDLTVITIVNDEQMQNGHTGLMLYRIPYLISYCSTWFTLEPGDIILTGTPAGVGRGMKPPRFLKNGDIVSVHIDPIGRLTNPCKTH